MKIYFDTKTGNVEKFLGKVAEYAKSQGQEIEAIRITEDTVPEEGAHFFTYTTGKGVMPKETEAFVAKHGEKLGSVSSSGSMLRHAADFCKAVDLIREAHGTDVLIRIDGEGDEKDVEMYYGKLFPAKK